MSDLDFRPVNTPQEIKRFIQFGIEVYRDNPYFRDSMSDIVSMFVHKRSSYLSHGEVYPFTIEQEGQILVRAAFVIDRKQVDMLMIAFFEAKPNAQAAVDLMLAKAKEHAANQGLRRIVVGLDAHLNYGVGFLASHHGVDPCFGFGFTPEYYLDYFRGLKEHRFTSFQVDIEQFNLAREQKVLTRIKRNGYSFRFADFKQLDREIELYTQLNNACFQNHLWWADRTFSEDKELLYPFRWFINGENLII
ncbi:MAG TPA: hypothetical protein VNU93_06240, partial [Verrucomicrobiae bacterium]|nr:hypothetical protein [Verrucomicrobiae bacterium]